MKLPLNLREQILEKKIVKAKPLREILSNEIEFASSLLEFIESDGDRNRIKYPEYAEQLIKFENASESTDIDLIYESRIELTKLTIKLEKIVNEIEEEIKWDIAMADLDRALGK